MIEARGRLADLTAVECERSGTAYELTVRRGGQIASSRLKARFWEEYLASGRTDNCGCVDAFFEHLDARLGS